MELRIGRVGNSAGLILPQTLLKELGLSIGQAFDAEKENGRLVLTPRRRRYSAAELNAQCDLSAAMPPDLDGWDQMPDVGLERVD